FPLIEDSLLAKVSFLGRSTNGWGRNHQPGADEEQLGRTSDMASRAQLRWLAATNLTFDVSADYSKHRGSGMPHGLVHFAPTAGTDLFNQTAAIPVGPQWIVDHPDDIRVDTPMRDELEVF